MVSSALKVPDQYAVDDHLRSVTSGFGNRETESSVFPANRLGSEYVVLSGDGTTVGRKRRQASREHMTCGR
jgi:hypothetical protein